ncbi:hypothetical protein RX717_09000 [Intestinibacillus sp. NTUH-41-i26]|uniref:hypothetical protein n=1 Tax=Intestinibacillus sp. NTUH-41-i26 TaxID=3079303 RepID=UPI0029346355|nr:hypothetical protein [Intestinibacillus sp. NTUH-41-i26]WOC74165.1 hypothetical protein RX717_09000 [Intestinibacillus sp. NTUH-41-i26]
MKTYTIIAGVNGAGKSSLTGVLRQEMDDLGVIIDVDKLAAANGGNNILAGRLAVARIRECLARGVCFTQETTLSGALTAHTARQARDRGYRVRMYYVGLDSAEESLARIANRVRKGGHDIPAGDVRRRFAGRVRALASVLPYCDEATFFDNDNGFAAVAEYRNGVIACFDGAPRWVRGLAEAVSQP